MQTRFQHFIHSAPCGGQNLPQNLVTQHEAISHVKTPLWRALDDLRACLGLTGKERGQA